MDIVSLSLSHWRNFKEVENIEFPPGQRLVAAAPNAAGKTNFLEAIVMLLRGKSWRATAAECVTWQQPFFMVGGSLRTQQGEFRLQVGYDVEGKKIHIRENGQPVSLVTLYGKYPIVLFLPEDTFLFTRGPEVRRNFLNSVLVSTPKYLAALVQYQRALRQRNAALKQARNFSDVAAWTELLVEQAAVIDKQRRMLTDFFATHVSRLYGEMSGEEGDFSVVLKTDVAASELGQRLEEDFSQEKVYGHTGRGPHRDDLMVYTQGRAVKAVLSQGQMRSLVIALKVASYRFLEQVSGERPMVLFDEVLSELDRGRQEALLTHLPESQMIITCTELPDFLQGRDDVGVLDVRVLAKGELVRESVAAG